MIADFAPRKLLVVDDEPLIRQTLCFILRDEYDVTAVASGEEALAASAREAFPVVILDLCMEGLSGIETLERLRKIRDDQNIIILTAFESTESAIEALNMGAFNYLTKPFERRHLKKVISRGFALHEQRHARQLDLQQRLMGVHDSFFSMLCHEFNTPMNAILGFSDLLATSTTDSELAAWAQHIKEAGSHLHDILMEIVDYISASHLATAGIERAFVPGSLLLPMLHGFREKEVRIDLRDELGDTELAGPSEAILMIARKMVGLASHYSRQIQLTVSAESLDGPNLRIVVNGTGIFRHALSPMDADRVFDPYRLVPNGDAARVMSLGLELATCKKIAEYAHASVDGSFDRNDELELVARIPVRML